MMKKMWKNRSGVSPVIATILMVAITVVLAAVLYVMVMGFGGTSTAPTAKLTASHVAGAGFDEKVEVTSISAATQFADMKVSLVIVTDAATPVTTTYTGTIGSDGTLTFSPAVTSVVTVSLVDLAGDKKISTGDYFTVTGATGTDGYSVTMNMLYGSDATSIASATWTIA